MRDGGQVRRIPVFPTLLRSVRDLPRLARELWRGLAVWTLGVAMVGHPTNPRRTAIAEAFD